MAIRTLKLVIWDLDETLLSGVLVEGDTAVNAVAAGAMRRLDERGILQALATQNPPALFSSAIQQFDWSGIFVQVRVSLEPKIRQVRSIIEALNVDPQDVAFVDDDPFERDAMTVQLPGLTAWSVSGLAGYLDTGCAVVTEEARRRPQMYRDQQARARDQATSTDLDDFLRACDIRLTIRPYEQADGPRAEELLTRTHRMNLGVLPIERALARLHQSGRQHLLIAELRDAYGDMGRCGLIDLTAQPKAQSAIIESLAISCRTRARGLSLALVTGLLRHPGVAFREYRCHHLDTGLNRPLRMLLLNLGFKPQPGTDDLLLRAEQLDRARLPDWVHIHYH